MFFPLEYGVGAYGLDPQGSHGLNTIRYLGGLPLGMMMMVVGLWRRNTTWFLAAALVVTTAAFGRLASFIFNGVDAADVAPVIMELLLAGLMLLANRKLKLEKERLIPLSLVS